MRDFYDHNDADGDEATTVFWKPDQVQAPVQPRLSPCPVRSYEVADRYAIPTPLAFAPPPVVAAPSHRPRVSHVHTVGVRRVRTPGTLIGLGFAGLCVLVGITIGGLIVLGGSSSSTAHATPAPVAAKPVVVRAPAPTIAPIVAPVARPMLVTVRVESNPPGATATIVDNGKSTLLGVTPVDAALDGSHAYDVVLTLEDHDTRIVHLDPATKQQVSATLVATAVEPAPAPEPAPVVVAPVTRHHHVTAHARTAHAVVAQAPAPITNGTLVVSSKPPTSIVVDGKPTGLTTPQKSLTLSTGRHEITLTNAGEGISLTTAVEITADRPTRLVQDFTK